MYTLNPNGRRTQIARQYGGRSKEADIISYTETNSRGRKTYGN